jgi:hypothetical protein
MAHQFAASLVKHVLDHDTSLFVHPKHEAKIQALQDRDTAAVLDLTPFVAQPGPVTAFDFFAGVNDGASLLAAYYDARHSFLFENDVPSAMENVSPYAGMFLEAILATAHHLTARQARLIADFVQHLDAYCAVKAVESLLNSKADIALLEVAADKGWDVHFDHLAIRCGSRKHQDAERVAQLLTDVHGYTAPQIAEEACYQFSDGWNAYPVYKILANGQVCRVFVDQSDADDTQQIIQHWNHVYGYTAHHLAMRATHLVNDRRIAVTLDELMDAMNAHGVDIMTPTGQYTSGLLLQVFTRPEKNTGVPADIRATLRAHSETLERTIENGKLLELVSRREMGAQFAERLFALYGLDYDPANPLHSAPIYQYFLPAQAAHVIKTSQAVA